MKVANFTGRKNARRVNALTRTQQSLAEVQKQISLYEAQAKASKNTDERQTAESLVVYFTGKQQRINKAIANTEAKIMPQGIAESLRSKKNRQGFSRQR